SRAGRDGNTSGSNAGNEHRCTGWEASRDGTPICSSCGSSACDRRLEGRSRMRREFHVRFCGGGRGRFPSATRLICHCKSAAEARVLWSAIADRFAACKLVLHPEKTKIVYCKDVNRRGDFPDIHFDFLGFQFRARKIMWMKANRRIFAHSFQPAASPKALTRISREIRSWALHHRSDKSLTELAQMYNPCMQDWITYYSHFYKTQLRPTLKRIDAYVIRWARRKFKRMRHQTKGARDWFDRLW